MSEYQYYEFRSIDRPLTGKEMASLRRLSSRAEITATSFVNVYNFGDFQGDPESLMESHFDAFLYVANWGTHRLMFRLPKEICAGREWEPFHTADTLKSWRKGGHVVVSFAADEIEMDWGEEGEGWLDQLLPIRADLLRGDFRSLYLGWLRAVQDEQLENDQPEPPLPPGLRNLSGPLLKLAEFLDIDRDLLDAAAENSADLEEPSTSPDMLLRWIAALPAEEKDRALFQVASGKDADAATSLVRRFERESRKAPAS